MSSDTSSQPQTINSKRQSEDTGFDFPLSPSEAGKFDFYRVHLNNQGHKNDSMFSDNTEALAETPKNWTPVAHMKLLSEQPKTSSLSTLFKTTDSDVSTSTKVSNKPIQTVASFASLTDAVRNAMQRGNINTTANQLQRQTNRSTVSTKDLNHLSPQSM